MGQVKIFGSVETLELYRREISDAVHPALVSAFDYPGEKRFQRFFPLPGEDFLHPADRTKDYLVIEVILFPGRSVEAKKAFYRLVLANLESSTTIPSADVEIVLIESSRENWLIRGMPGDELKLNYRVEV